MKKVILVLFAVVCLSMVTNAQKDLSVSVGPVIAIPMGDFGDVYNLGFGLTARGEYPFSKELVGIATLGYVRWSGDIEGWGSSTDYTTSLIPIRAGIKYNLLSVAPGLYLMSELGLHFYSSSWEGGGIEGDESDTEFAFVLGGGYDVAVSKSMLLDLSGAFVIVSDANYLELRAGLKFPLGK